MQTLPVEDQPTHERARLREEYKQLHDEYLVLRQKAERLGEMLCEIGSALRHSPELIVVKPSFQDAVASSAIVLANHPPTLLAIERVATEIRAAQQRLMELQEVLSEGPSSASAA